MAGKRVMIAGGAGFLGSYLCDYYINQKYEVICLDNISTGSKNNIRHLQNEAKFLFVNHNIAENLPPEIVAEKYDLILNLASPASPPHYQRLAVETLDAGSIGTKNLLELAKKDKARFFQASTSEVYGDPEIHPQPESYWGNVNSYGPRSMYDESKRFAEALIYVYRHRKGVDTAIVRIFNTYGPRMDPKDGRVVSNFITQALKGESLTVYGDGTQTRSFCYVDDLIRGFVAMIESDEEGPINLGNSDEFTILQLANLVKELANSNSKIVFKPLPGDDPLQRKPVIKKAKQSLGWSPNVPLKEGLIKTISYFKQNLN